MGIVPEKYVLTRESNGNVTMDGLVGSTVVETYSLNSAKDIRISQSYPNSIVIPVNSIGNHVDNKFVCIPWDSIDFIASTPTSIVTNIFEAVEALGRDFFYEAGAVGPQGPTGATGAQGPIGPQGVPGPVGPAGLNWQGAWSASGTYVVDDAVGYNGASWFCINNVGPSATPPDTDTTNWALLAAQGATGPQGPQGIQGPAGTEAAKTQGTVFGTVSTTDPSNVLIYDRINVGGTTNLNVRLPENAPIGKEIIVQYGSISLNDFVNVRCFNLGIGISVNDSNSNTTVYQLYGSETVRFISRGSNFWIAEYIIGTNMRFNNSRISSNANNIVESTVNSTITPLTLITLNGTYFTGPIGLKVYCPFISGGGLVYIKTGITSWVTSPITAVV